MNSGLNPPLAYFLKNTQYTYPPASLLRLVHAYAHLHAHQYEYTLMHLYIHSHASHMPVAHMHQLLLCLTPMLMCTHSHSAASPCTHVCFPPSFEIFLARTTNLILRLCILYFQHQVLLMAPIIILYAIKDKSLPGTKYHYLKT